MLESSDLPVSNSALIREAHLAALDARDDVPDEVYLAETISAAWFVSPLIVDGGYWPIGSVDGMELPAAELVDLRYAERLD